MESSGFYKSGGKQPDDVSLLCLEMLPALTLAPLRITSATSNAGAVDAVAEERKLALFGNVVLSHYFVPIAFETSRVIGPQSRLYLKEMGHSIKLITR